MLRTLRAARASVPPNAIRRSAVEVAGADASQPRLADERDGRDALNFPRPWKRSANPPPVEIAPTEIRRRRHPRTRRRYPSNGRSGGAVPRAVQAEAAAQGDLSYSDPLIGRIGARVRSDASIAFAFTREASCVRRLLSRACSLSRAANSRSPTRSGFCASGLEPTLSARQVRLARRLNAARALAIGASDALGAMQLRCSRMPIRAVLSGSPAVETGSSKPDPAL